MRKHTRSIIFILALSAILCVSCAQAEEKVFPPAPDFELQDTYQDTYTLSSYKNKQSVLLFFWTTWCPFCRRELKFLNDMYATLQKDGVEVLAINVGETQSRAEAFIRNYYLSYKVLLDRDARVSHAYEVVGVPTYAFISKEGYVLFHENFFPSKEYNDLIGK
jgi:peroxiredoxin